jgi:hypothetical protein
VGAHPKTTSLLRLGAVTLRNSPIGAAFRGTSRSPDFPGENVQPCARKDTPCFQKGGTPWNFPWTILWIGVVILLVRYFVQP